MGEVFVWGFGILGKGPNLSESSTPEKLPSTLFGQSEFNPDVKATRIRCGLNHFAAVTSMFLYAIIFLLIISDDFTSMSRITCVLLYVYWFMNAGHGELFVWGKNVRGCLGIGRPDDQYFPWRVSTGLCL